MAAWLGERDVPTSDATAMSGASQWDKALFLALPLAKATNLMAAPAECNYVQPQKGSLHIPQCRPSGANRRCACAGSIWHARVQRPAIIFMSGAENEWPPKLLVGDGCFQLRLARFLLLKAACWPDRQTLTHLLVQAAGLSRGAVNKHFAPPKTRGPAANRVLLWPAVQLFRSVQAMMLACDALSVVP